MKKMIVRKWLRNEENRQLWVDGEGLRDDYCDGDGDIYREERRGIRVSN